MLPPSSIMLDAWHIGPVPPPHSSVWISFLPSLLKAAVCRPWKLFVSVSASSRTGFSGFVMSTRMECVEQAAASRFSAGYAVTSWQLRGPVCAGIPTGAAALAASPGAPPRRGPPPRGGRLPARRTACTRPRRRVP